MGTMFEARCPCGYTSDSLLEGCGISGPDGCRDLARCESCREIVSIRSSALARGCPSCRSEVEVIAIEEESPAEPARSSCPRCAQETLALISVGEWD